MRGIQPLIALSLLLALPACSEPGVAASGDPASGPKPTRTSVPLVQRKIVVMSASKACGDSNLERSLCMMELMIEDIRKTYDWPSGGGIGEIKSNSSTSYTVSLPQEERADLFTYEFGVSAKSVSIKTKTSATQSY